MSAQDAEPGRIRLGSKADGGTTVALSRHGNIVEFNSPAGFEHIGTGTFSEGYVVCYTPAGGSQQKAYDTGASESNFGDARGSRTPPWFITRRTTDGAVELRQDYSINGPRKTLRIKMTLINRSAAALENVILRRQVDFDIDAGGDLGWASAGDNHHAADADSYFAWNDSAGAPSPDVAHAMTLRHVSQSPGVVRHATVTDDILETDCEPPAFVPNYAARDDGGTVWYQLGTLAPRQKKVVTIEYVRH